MKFTSFAAVSAFATVALSAPVKTGDVTVKQLCDGSVSLPVNIASICAQVDAVVNVDVLSGRAANASNIPDALGNANSTISGLLSKLQSGDITSDQATGIVQQLTSSLGGLNGVLGLLKGLDLGTLLGGDSDETVAQKVADLLNGVLSAVSSLETTLGNIAPELKDALTELNTVLQTLLNLVTGLVNTLNSLLTPLLAPVTGILKSLGLNLNLGLLGL